MIAFIFLLVGLVCGIASLIGTFIVGPIIKLLYPSDYKPHKYNPSGQSHLNPNLDATLPKLQREV